MTNEDARRFSGEQVLSETPEIYVSLTYEPLDSTVAMTRVKSAKAGAVVLFAGMSGWSHSLNCIACSFSLTKSSVD